MNHIIGYNLRILYRFKNISLLRVFERYNITFDGGGGNSILHYYCKGYGKERLRKREK